jgi:transcriptional regulator with XRE-family HTH domain
MFSDQKRHLRFLLGLYISRKRLELGYSIYEVAFQLQLTSLFYKRIESGRAKMKTDIFYKIQALLFLDADDLHDIRRISRIAYVNDLAKALSANYPS